MAEQLVPLTKTDLEIVRRWRNDSDIRKYMFSQNLIGSEEHLDWFKDQQGNNLRNVLLYKIDNKNVGFMQLDKLDESGDVYEWGFYVDPSAQKGSGTKMAQSVLAYVFKTLKAHKIIGKVLGFNTPSIKFHKKVGFQLEGILHGHVFIKKRYQDIYCFGLLYSDWKNQKGTR